MRQFVNIKLGVILTPPRTNVVGVMRDYAMACARINEKITFSIASI